MIQDPLPWQRRVLDVPEDIGVMMGGGRGGGKSSASALLVLRHEVMYGARTKQLVVRPDTYKGAADFEDQLEALFRHTFGGRVSLNRQQHVLHVVDGGGVEFSALTAETARNFQGRQFGQIVADEAGNFTTLRHLDRLRSNLRMPGVPTRLVISANPGGPAHALLARRYVSGRIAWRPFTAPDGLLWVYAPSTFTDNPAIDAATYRAGLRASVGGDEALLKAWETGDWNAISESFFGSVLSDALWLPHDDGDEWRAILKRRPSPWRTSVAIDWGITAPSVALFGARAMQNGAEGAGGRRYQAGSLVVVDEIATVSGEDPNVGAGWSWEMLAEAVLERCGSWGVDPGGVIDDARGLQDETLIELFRKRGLALRRPVKNRSAGWTKLKGMMAATRDDNPDLPGLWISERCRYLAETLPTLQRNQLKPEDLTQFPKQPDHGADALRYLACDEPFVQRSGGGVLVVSA